MSKFRKIPIIVNAVQFLATQASWDALVSELGFCYKDWDPGPMGEECFFLITQDGNVKVHKGDWVIKDDKGVLQPCKQDFFTLNYEEIEDA